MRADHLIDEDQMIFFHRRQIDRFFKFGRQPFEQRTRQRDEVAAHRGGEPHDGGPEADAAVRRRRDHQLFSLQRGDDALHGGARQTYPLRNLSEAESGILIFERAQDGGGARDHLHLAFVVGGVAIHFYANP